MTETLRLLYLLLLFSLVLALTLAKFIHIPSYLKYLLLRDKGWCLQAVRTAGHTLDSTSKRFLVS